jgi:hypothetical protein
MLYISSSFLNTFITTSTDSTRTVVRYDVLGMSTPTLQQAQQAAASTLFEGKGKYKIS